MDKLDYVIMFMNRKQLNKSNYDATILIKDVLKISVCLPKEINFKYFTIYLSFYLDSLSMTISTDDKQFQDSYFYKYFIKTNLYKKAWTIIKKKYEKERWIEKFIIFIMQPSNSFLSLLENAEHEL